MNVRSISAMFAAALCALIARPATAAESVFGPGPAQRCFEAADQGLPAGENLIFCNVALSTVLMPHDRAATFVNRGVLKLNLLEYNSAAADFKAGLEINDQMGEGYIDLGATDVGRQNYADAVAHITRGLALGTTQPEVAYFDRAMANEGLGQVKDAYDDYRKALSIAPGFIPASNALKRFKVVEKPSGT